MTTLRTLTVLFTCLIFTGSPAPRVAAGTPPADIKGTFEGDITFSDGTTPFTLTVTRQSPPNRRDRSLIRGTAVAGTIRLRFKGTLTGTQLVARGRAGNVIVRITGTAPENGASISGNLRATQRGRTVADGTFIAERPVQGDSGS
ncbi:MAG TPA: hypothetical protein VK689_04680 [Armatimonadota bacterium]|nr:hypothetical protein [Armatimonadota bacterium]